MSVSVQNLEASLGAFQLGPITTEFASSGLYLIRGKNGAGKTSFLRTLLGRIRKRSGTIDGLQFPVGCVGVENLLMGAWTVKENIQWFGNLIAQEIELPQEISELAHQRIDHLSQGLKRQVELSMILGFRLPTLFLDEPLSPLDRNQRKYYGEKIRLAGSKSLILLTTHFEEELFGAPKGILEL